MIKIIKEGKKEFKVVCLTCGCEFSYELDDLKRGIAYSTIKCPCCGDEIVHSDVRKEFAKGIFVPPRSNTNSATSDPGIRDNMIWETPEYRTIQKEPKRLVEDPPSFVPCDNKTNPCLACPFYIGYLSQGKAYVGDAPCQWCQYSGLKVTCTSTDSTVNGMK